MHKTVRRRLLVFSKPKVRKLKDLVFLPDDKKEDHILPVLADFNFCSFINYLQKLIQNRPGTSFLLVRKKSIINKISAGLLMILVAFSTQFIFAEEIHLNSGKIVIGKIVEETDEYVKAEIRGITLTFFNDEISKIKRREFEKKESKVIKTISYKVQKDFQLKALTNLTTLQFTFPLMRTDIPHQRISNIKIFPKANALIDDPDGNKIAIFYFSFQRVGQDTKIRISYDVEIEQLDLDLDLATMPDTYDKTDAELRNYLLNEKEILADKRIRRGAKTIVSGKDTPYTKAKAIYDYLVENIKYQNVENGSGLQKAYSTLANKKGNCADIAKLYVTLAKASDIPARQVDGIVFQPNDSSSKSITEKGHAWVEIYLPGYGWLPVDPTFGISEKDKYFCFSYEHHIKECYGQIISKDSGSLYRGSTIEARTAGQVRRVPVDIKGEIEIELVVSSNQKSSK